jgi:hypothetical protein
LQCTELFLIDGWNKKKKKKKKKNKQKKKKTSGSDGHDSRCAVGAALAAPLAAIDGVAPSKRGGRCPIDLDMYSFQATDRNDEF